MTPGILALIALGVLVVGMIVVILNFLSAAKGNISGKTFVLHIVGAGLSGLGSLGLVFSALWFLVLQVGKGG